MPSGPAKAFLSLLLVLFPISVVGWHVVDTRPSSMDETRHMKLAMDYRAWVLHAVPLTNEWSHVYPPFYHFSIIPALSLGRPSETKVAATNVLYGILFVAGCLLLGRCRGRPDWESILAAFLCLGYAYVLWTARRALIDFPLMAWVTLSIALLACTEGFSSFPDSLLFGVVAGIGLLIKPPFAFFIVGPALWTLFAHSGEKKFKNVFSALVVCLVIGVPWYFWQGGYFLSKASSLAAEAQGPGADPHTLSGWLFYAKLLQKQMGTPSLVFTVIGIFLAFIRPPREGNGILVAWILSGYILLSMLANKDPRHTLALLPAFALLAAKGWSHFANDLGSPVLLCAVAPALMIFNLVTVDKPMKENWQHAPILELMAQSRDTTQPFMLASVLSHQPYFFSRTLKWSAMQNGIDLELTSTGDGNVSFPEFLITRPGDQGTETAFMEQRWQELAPQTRAFTSLFPVRARFVLPDHSTAILYQRTPHPQFNVQPLTAGEIERRIAQALGQWIQGTPVVSVEALPEELKEGRLRRIHITCSPCWTQGVRIESAELVVEKPWLDLYRLWDEHHLGLMAFQSIKPAVELHQGDLVAALSRAKGLKDAGVDFQNGKVVVHGKYKGIPVTAIAEAFIDLAGYAHAEAVLDSLSIAGIPLPGWILGKAHRQTLPLYPVPDFPGQIDVHQVVIDDGKLQLN